MCLCQAKRLKEQEEMLAKERRELAAIEEQRRAQEKQHAKAEFRYSVQTVSNIALSTGSAIIEIKYLWSFFSVTGQLMWSSLLIRLHDPAHSTNDFGSLVKHESLFFGRIVCSTLEVAATMYCRAVCKLTIYITFSFYIYITFSIYIFIHFVTL